MDEGQNANSQSLTPRPGVRVGSRAAKLGTGTVPIGVYLYATFELPSPYSSGKALETWLTYSPLRALYTHKV